MIALNVKVGIFDSGIGGLNILQLLKNSLQNAEFIYLADNINLPYGNKTQDEILRFTQNIIRFFLTQGTEVIIVPCNTSSASAIDKARKEFKNVKIFDIISPIVDTLSSKFTSLAVIATDGTVKTNVYLNKFKEKNHNISILQIPCPELVPIIENNLIDRPETKGILESYLHPVIANQMIEGLIYGCTHYQYLDSQIKNTFEEKRRSVQILNPDDFLLRHILQNIPQGNVGKKDEIDIRYYTTGDKEQFFQNAKKNFNFIISDEITELKNFH